jgi:branched-chain amino acid transport system permease protein
MFLAISVLLVALGIAPLFMNNYFTSVLIVIGIHTMLTVGLCLLMGYAGQVSLGHAAFYGIGAFLSGILSATYHVNPWLAMVLAAVATGSIAYVVSFPIFQLRGNYLAMATLGFGIIMWVLFRELDQFTGGPSGLPGVPYLSIGGFAFNTDLEYYYLVWLAAIAILLISQNIVNSRTGRALRSIQSNEDAARSTGINVAGFKAKVFVLAAVYASIAGSLYTHYLTFVGPDSFGFLFSVKLVLMAVFGGLASIWGAIFGTASVKILGELLHPFGDLDIIIFGLLLMVIMVFMPQGLTRGFGPLVARFRARFGSNR